MHISSIHTAEWQKSNGDNFPTLTTLVLVHPHLCLQTWLYCVTQVKYIACSPKCCSWNGAGTTLLLFLWAQCQFSHLPQAFMCRKRRKSFPCCHRQIDNRNSSSELTISCLAHPHICQQGWLYCATLARCRACSAKCFSWRGPRTPLLSALGIDRWGRGEVRNIFKLAKLE